MPIAQAHQGEVLPHHMGSLPHPEAQWDTDKR